MVTDATVERARVPISYPVRVILTLVLLAAYVCSRIPLPWVDRDALLEMRIGGGLRHPESGDRAADRLRAGRAVLADDLTGPAPRLSPEPPDGRRWLRAALATSLLLAGVQATGIARTLETMPSPTGLPIVASPGLAFMLLTVATLTAATAALFVLGQALSAYGIGNGFALLLLTRAVLPILQSGSRSLTILDAQFQGTILLLAVGAAVGIVLFFRRAEDAWLPAFPQGLVPAQVAVSVSPLVWLAIAWLVHIPRDVRPPAFAGPLMALVLIPLLSWAAFHLFSSRARLQANLTDPVEFLDVLAASLRRRAVGATALLALGTAASLAWRIYRPNPLAFVLDFTDLVLLLAIVLDVWDQYRFQRRGWGRRPGWSSSTTSTFPIGWRSASRRPAWQPCARASVPLALLLLRRPVQDRRPGGCRAARPRPGGAAGGGDGAGGAGVLGSTLADGRWLWPATSSPRPSSPHLPPRPPEGEGVATGNARCL